MRASAVGRRQLSLRKFFSVVIPVRKRGVVYTLGLGRVFWGMREYRRGQKVLLSVVLGLVFASSCWAAWSAHDDSFPGWTNIDFTTSVSPSPVFDLVFKSSPISSFWEFEVNGADSGMDSQDAVFYASVLDPTPLPYSPLISEDGLSWPAGFYPADSVPEPSSALLVGVATALFIAWRAAASRGLMRTLFLVLLAVELSLICWGEAHAAWTVQDDSFGPFTEIWYTTDQSSGNDLQQLRYNNGTWELDIGGANSGDGQQTAVDAAYSLDSTPLPQNGSITANGLTWPTDWQELWLPPPVTVAQLVDPSQVNIATTSTALSYLLLYGGIVLAAVVVGWLLAALGRKAS